MPLGMDPLRKHSIFTVMGEMNRRVPDMDGPTLRRIQAEIETAVFYAGVVGADVVRGLLSIYKAAGGREATLNSPQGPQQT